MQNAIKTALGDKPIQMEIDKGLITVKDEKGEYLFSMKGKVKIEETLRVKECEKCNSEGRKKELEALEKDRKELEADEKNLAEKADKLNEDTKAVLACENKLKVREDEIKAALKTLCK